MIRIIVADDHAVVRAGICKLLDSEPDMEIVGQADDGQEALTLCRDATPNVAIMDLSMPNMDGLEATRRIGELYPNVRVLVLTMYDNEEFVHRFQNAGAAGFLPKKISYDELPFAVRKVASGNTYFTSSISTVSSTAAMETGEVLPSALLSEREFQVFLRIARGVSLSSISEELSLSYSTVKTYKSRVMEKMNFGSIAELTKYAIKKGLVDDL